jgi:hypothetical protein
MSLSLDPGYGGLRLEILVAMMMTQYRSAPVSGVGFLKAETAVRIRNQERGRQIAGAGGLE